MYATTSSSSLTHARTTAGVTPSRERRRVARHIRDAELAARARSTAALDPLRRMVRGLLLDELTAYRTRGRFPRNPDLAEQTPFFVDADGVRCAMAHLLEVGGEGALVERIAGERNNAWIRELSDEPRLLAWLAAAGLTVAEAAAIQPSYCAAVTTCVCGGGFASVQYPVPASGVLEGVVIAQGDGAAMVRIEQIHGVGGAYEIGGSFSASIYGAAVGQRVLAPFTASTVTSDGGTRTLPAITLDDTNAYTCPATTRAPAVSRELFISAVQSSDCAGTLVEADGAWARNSCDGDGGCAASGGMSSAPTTLGILLAIVAVIARRRRKSAETRGAGATPRTP